MLKLIRFSLLFSIIITACNNTETKEEAGAGDSADTEIARDTIPIFPVTDYLLGQISNIEKSPVTLLKTIENGGTVDSIWFEREDAKTLAQAFLNPVIDSASLQKYFVGNSFLDQTINAFTFTYTPKQGSDEVTDLKEIDVYIDPQTSEVNRIYLVKENGDTTTQLTWKSGNWFSIRKLINGNVTEEKVKWNFTE